MMSTNGLLSPYLSFQYQVSSHVSRMYSNCHRLNVDLCVAPNLTPVKPERSNFTKCCMNFAFPTIPFICCPKIKKRILKA